jgi:hypothetical protein
MRKGVKVLFAVLIVVVALAMALTACHGGKYKMQDFVVDFSELAKTYEVGDTVDLSKVKMYATFSDGTQQDIPLDRVSIKVDGVQIGLNELSKITETTGTKIVEIKYSDVTRSVTIRVNEKHIAVLTGVEFDATNVVKEYDVLDAVSLEGLKVWAIYDEHERRAVALDDEQLDVFADGVIIDDLDDITATVGNKAITIRYAGKPTSDFFTIVVNDVLDSVTVNVPANLKKDYKVGDAVNFDSVTATANYRSGRKVNDLDVKFYLGTEEIASLASLTETAGQKVVKAKAVSGEVEGSADITLNVANFVTGISLSTDGVQLEYVAGDEISIADFAGVKVNVTYADSTDPAIADKKQLALTAEGVACVNANDQAIDFAALTAVAGTKAITVKYEGQEAEFSVLVIEADSALESLSVTTQPTKTAYTAGETGVSLAGLVITGVYKDELSRDDDVIAYADFEDADVKLYYNSALITDLDNLTKIEKLGANTVTIVVSYLSKTAEVELTVTNNVTALQILANPTKVAYLLQEDFDIAGLSVKAVKNFGEQVLSVSDLAIFDGTTDVTSNLNALTASVADEKAVTVKFGGQEASFNISVADYITGLELQGTKEFACDVNVTAGSKFEDFEGLNVYAVYKSGAKELLSSGYTFSGNAITSPGSKDVSVHYQDFEIGGVTLVVNEVLLSIAVDESTIPTKLYKNADVEKYLVTIKVNGTYASKGVEEINLLQEKANPEDPAHFLSNVSIALKVDGVYQTLVATNLNPIASESGERQIKLTYTWAEGRQCSVEFVINVLVSGNGVNGFEAPAALTKRDAVLDFGKNNTDINSDSFEGALFVDNEDYLVGDDNPYRFIPILTQINIESGSTTPLVSFAAASTIYLVNNDESLTQLVGTKDGTYSKNWSLSGTVYVRETTNENKYQFTADAIGKKFKISVLPDPNEFVYSSAVKAAEQTVKVVDGYNIYDSREICLLEQSTRPYWDSLKTELGLTGAKPSSIILHDNLQVTKDSIPSAFYFTLDSNYSVVYKNGDNKYSPEQVPEELGGPLSRSFIWDELDDDGEYGLLQYNIEDGHDFAIHGNYYDIDLSKLPLVCAFNADVDTQGHKNGAYYGQYNSKLSFLDIRGENILRNSNGERIAVTKEDIAHEYENDEHFYFDNFAVKGNCSQKQLIVDSATTGYVQDEPVYGGGIIFVKTHYCHADVTNVNVHGCFIAFFSRDYTVVNYTKCKAYDSFLNGMFAHSETDVQLNNCHFKRAGGPLMIMCQSSENLDLDGGGSKEYMEIPRVFAGDDCVFECPVTGQEQWFSNNQAPISMLAILDKALNNDVQKTFLKSIDGKSYFNLICVLIEDGNAFGSAATQGYMSYKGEAINRIDGGTTFETTKAVSAYNQTKGIPITPYVGVGTTFCIDSANENDYTACHLAGLDGTAPPASTYQEFKNNHDYVVIYYSGLGILTGMWDYVG